MSDGPNTTGDWVIFCAAMTGLGILGLLIFGMGILAAVLICQIIADIWRFGL